MCLECSGRHRALGVHISFVRSVSMDSWNDKQIQMMRVGGNEKCISFLRSYNVEKSMPIPQKYNTPAALLYRDRISAEVEGRPLPTELPIVKQSSGGGAHVAQGSDPLPGESEAAYVARQKQLQNEARERMRQKFGSSNGLSSSGKMQGIGSDPNYGQSKGGEVGLGGIPIPPIDYAQIGEASQKALSFVTSSLAVLGEHVQKAAQPPPEQPGNNWLGGIWKQATDVTGDIVKIISSKDLDDDQFYKFPRPEDNKTVKVEAVSAKSSLPPKAKGRSPREQDEWDDLGGLSLDDSNADSSSSSRGRPIKSRSSSSSSLSLSVPVSGAAAPSSQGGNTPLSSTTTPTTGPPIPVPSPAMRSESGSNLSAKAGVAKKMPVQNPSGDDFFANFGV